MRNTWKPRPAEARPAPEPTVQQQRAARVVEVSKQIARLRSEYEWADGQLMQLRFQFKGPRGEFIGNSIEDATAHRQQEFRLMRAQDELRVKLSGLLSEYSILSERANEVRHIAGVAVDA